MLRRSRAEVVLQRLHCGSSSKRREVTTAGPRCGGVPAFSVCEHLALSRRTLRAVSPDISELQERAAQNEARYRALNEQMERHNAVHVWVDPPMPDWICECASTDCMGPVRLTFAEYEAVRAESTHFFVVPSEDHLSPAVEHMVQRNERYWVVEMIGEAAEVSDELDPRPDP